MCYLACICEVLDVEVICKSMILKGVAGYAARRGVGKETGVAVGCFLSFC